MPTRRSDVLKVFENGDSFTAREVADFLKKNYKTVKRNLDEMVSLGVIDQRDGDSRKGQVYSPKPEFVSMFAKSPKILEESLQKIDEVPSQKQDESVQSQIVL